MELLVKKGLGKVSKVITQRDVMLWACVLLPLLSRTGKSLPPLSHSQGFLKILKMCKYFQLLSSLGCSVNMSRKNYFQGLNLLICWLLKRVDSSFKKHTTIAQHVSLVYDISNTDCWAQNGCTLGCVFMTLKGLFLRNRMRSWVTNCCMSIFSFLFLLVGPVVHLWFGSPLSCWKCREYSHAT